MGLFDINTVEQIELRMIRPFKEPVRYSAERNTLEFENLRAEVNIPL